MVGEVAAIELRPLASLFSIREKAREKKKKKRREKVDSLILLLFVGFQVAQSEKRWSDVSVSVGLLARDGCGGLLLSFLFIR